MGKFTIFYLFGLLVVWIINIFCVCLYLYGCIVTSMRLFYWTRGQDTVLYSYISIFMHLFLAMAMIEQARHCSSGLTKTFLKV